MLSSQLNRRETLLNQSYAILDRLTDRSSLAFIKEMTWSIEGLIKLAKETDVTDGDPLERSRNWRHVGYLYFEMADAKDLSVLKLSVNAFKKSAELLSGIDDKKEQMKLNYLYGQALLNLSEGKDLALLEEARNHFTLSLEASRIEHSASINDITLAIDHIDEVKRLLFELNATEQGIEEQKQRLKASDEKKTELNEMHDDLQYMFGMLKEVYEKELKTGKVTDTRHETLHPIFSQLETLINTKTTTLEESQNRRSRVGELMERIRHLVANGSHGTPAITGLSRAEKIWRLFSDIKLFLTSSLTQPQLGNEEKMYGMDLFVECGRADHFLHQPEATDEKVLDYECDKLRKLASEVRNYALRSNLTLISPIWSSTAWLDNPNAIFFSGNKTIREVIAKVCSANKLRLLTSNFPRDYAAERFDQLRSSNVAVFDFSACNGNIFDADTDDQTETTLFGVAYEMGIALALGHPVVVLANKEQTLPFDVDIEPIRLYYDGNDDNRIDEAINQILYSLQRGNKRRNMVNTFAFLNEYFKYSNTLIDQSLKIIDKKALEDPIRFRRSIESIIGIKGPGAPQIVYPSWPSSYPAADNRCCFHVMPFGQDWSEKVMDSVDKACRDNGNAIKYIRGDKVLNPDIINSIWDSLCQATHIVVDLTGYNANVGLELGIAHTLGRNILMVTQDKESVYPPSIAKMRIHRYSVGGTPELISFSRTIESFLEAS